MGGLTGAAGSADDEVLLARAYLSRVAEPANIPLWEWVCEHGPVQAVAAIRSGDAPKGDVAATAARARSVDPEADLDAAARHGIRLLTPESPDWPHFALAALEAAGRARLARYRGGDRAPRRGGEPIPPLALWLRGALSPVDAAVRSAALVGSRASTAYGEQVAAEFGYGLAAHGVTVVSGGAYGIDAAAHRGALAGDGATVLVSAGGLDRPYPAGNARLYDRVAESGLLVSESPPGAAPQRHRFLTRNRIIAALSTGTVVIEAASRSGALNTAHHARELGRPVMAVPGPVTSVSSAGCHRLLRQGADWALLVATVDDVLGVVGSIGEGLVAAPNGVGGEPGSTGGPGSASEPALRDVLDGLDPTARRVFDGLPARGAAREDELAVRCGLSPLEVIRALPVLALAGLVDSDDAGFRISASARRRLRPASGAARQPC